MPIKEQQFTPAIWFELKPAPKGTPIGYFTEVSYPSSEVEADLQRRRQERRGPLCCPRA